MQTDDSQDGVKIAFNHSKTNCIAKIHCTNKVMKPKLHVEVNIHICSTHKLLNMHIPRCKKITLFLQKNLSIHCNFPEVYTVQRMVLV